MKKSDLYQRFDISRNKVSYTEGDVVYTLNMDLSLWYDRHCSDRGLTLSDLNHLLKFIEAAEFLGLTDDFYMQVNSDGVIQTLKPLEIGTTDDNKGLLMPSMKPSDDNDGVKIYE